MPELFSEIGKSTTQCCKSLYIKTVKKVTVHNLLDKKGWLNTSKEPILTIGEKPQARDFDR